MEMTPEIVNTILQIGGTPAALAFMLYHLWTNGPKQDLHRMAQAVEGVKQDLGRVLDEQQAQRDRLVRLEVKAEISNRSNVPSLNPPLPPVT